MHAYITVPTAVQQQQHYYSTRGSIFHDLQEDASLRKEKYTKIMRSGQRSMIDSSVMMVVVANWRLDHAKSPASTLYIFRKKQLGRHMYVPGMSTTPHVRIPSLRFSPRTPLHRHTFTTTTPRTRSARTWGTQRGYVFRGDERYIASKFSSLLRACTCCVLVRRVGLANVD